uniref:Cir_N domain-containing protein n=1 Tax=Steinernema glaseri TaxID=37863 RepID=A0A1I7ZN14_9BILA
MGKGFTNFMSKKDFHPSAWRNVKKVWEARQKPDMELKRQEELRVQYEKEQEMLQNKA